MGFRSGGVLVIIALIIVVECSTQTRPHPSPLRLQIRALPQQVSVGDELVLSYRLTNTGPVTLETCFTFKNGYSLWGGMSVKQSVSAVDHPGCVEMVSIAPQQSLEWSSTIALPDVGHGAARLAGWVEIAMPGTCDAHGCDQETIRSSEEAIIIRARQETPPRPLRSKSRRSSYPAPRLAGDGSF